MYLFFDTETTGLPGNYKAPVTDLNNWPRLVQIAWILHDETGKNITSECYVIKPIGFTIPLAASNLHRVTTARASAEGVDLKTVLTRFNEHITSAKYLIAHNISFDEKIVGAEFIRNGMTNSIPNKNRICTMEKSKNHCALPGQYGYKNPRLIELHKKLFGCGFDGAHDANADISATAKCFWEMRRRGLV